MPPMFALLALMLVGVVLVSLLLLRARQSLLVGYFLCGVVIANSGVLRFIGLDASSHAIQETAEFGVVLLLFTLGLEFSLGELRYLKKLAFWGGGLQMGVTLALVLVAGLAWGWDVRQALIFAVACALSSTAISMKVFQDLGLAASPGARMALAVAIFQDLFVIGFLVILPLIFPETQYEEQRLAPQLGLVVAKGILFVGISFVLARWVIPALLHAVTLTRSRELFTLTVTGLCIGVAFIAGLLNLSLALGAFVAGLAVSESIYKHRILADVLPIKDLFLTLFFVSVGLLIDLPTALRHAGTVALITVLLLVGKTVLIVFIARWLKIRWRSAVLAAMSLCSGGEFSLVLIEKVGQHHAWPGDWSQISEAVIALSMGLMPMFIRWADPLGDWLEKKLKASTHTPVLDLPPAKRARVLQDHAVICGYGPVGEELALALDQQGISSLVIELNATTVKALSKAGQPVLFADATHHETWQLAGLDRARLVAFTFPDAQTTHQALQLVRQVAPSITVLARTKFRSEAEHLQQQGVDIVILDEEESAKATVRESLAIFERQNRKAAATTHLRP